MNHTSDVTILQKSSIIVGEHCVTEQPTKKAKNKRKKRRKTKKSNINNENNDNETHDTTKYYSTNMNRNSRVVVPKLQLTRPIEAQRDSTTVKNLHSPVVINVTNVGLGKDNAKVKQVKDLAEKLRDSIPPSNNKVTFNTYRNLKDIPPTRPVDVNLSVPKSNKKEDEKQYDSSDDILVPKPIPILSTRQSNKSRRKGEASDREIETRKGIIINENQGYETNNSSMHTKSTSMKSEGKTYLVPNRVISEEDHKRKGRPDQIRGTAYDPSSTTSHSMSNSTKRATFPLSQFEENRNKVAGIIQPSPLAVLALPVNIKAKKFSERLDNFEQHYRQVTSKSDCHLLHLEYNSLKDNTPNGEKYYTDQGKTKNDGIVEDFTCGSKMENIDRNRFRDVRCLDGTRYKLNIPGGSTKISKTTTTIKTESKRIKKKEKSFIISALEAVFFCFGSTEQTSTVRRIQLHTLPKSDYIHANWLTGINSYNKITPKCYIATQGPMLNTAGHFWEMVIDSKAGSVIQVTKHFENMREKCFNYWPKKKGEKRSFEGEHLNTGEGKILVENVESLKIVKGTYWWGYGSSIKSLNYADSSQTSIEQLPRL